MFKKILSIVTVVTSLGLAGAATTTLAKTAGGGTWNYGIGWNGLFGYSDYLHATRKHSSSVGPSTSDRNKDFASAGNWSQAKYYKIPPTGLNYWWSYE
ncbi:MAG: lactococcin 972 family bacteriocin [Lactobacillus sp.]|nr:lactococcin 972 family bacteriocin [Lactobacillus sp.]